VGTPRVLLSGMRLSTWKVIRWWSLFSVTDTMEGLKLHAHNPHTAFTVIRSCGNGRNARENGPSRDNCTPVFFIHHNRGASKVQLIVGSSQITRN
jgi:hypothetical protein